MTATGDVDALLATEADCVLYSPFMADPDVVAAILESGKNVVTPLGWFYPPAEEREQFDAVAKAAGVTLHGTGIHPGGITERFPLMISALVGLRSPMCGPRSSPTSAPTARPTWCATGCCSARPPRRLAPAS